MPIAMQETTKQILEILASRGRSGPLHIFLDPILYPQAGVELALQELPEGVLVAWGSDRQTVSGFKVAIPDDPSEARLLVGELLNRLIVRASLSNG
jgi:hypothetical protein